MCAICVRLYATFHSSPCRSVNDDRTPLGSEKSYRHVPKLRKRIFGTVEANLEIPPRPVDKIKLEHAINVRNIRDDVYNYNSDPSSSCRAVAPQHEKTRLPEQRRVTFVRKENIGEVTLTFR